jgi:hypothetical protein
MHTKMLSVLQQLLARGARLLVVCCQGDADVEELCEGRQCSLIRVPQASPRGEGGAGCQPSLCPAPACGLLARCGRAAAPPL